MIVRSIETTSFRNLEDQRVTAHPRFNVLSGDNAQGKTNFLESIHLVGTLRPIRASRNAELVRFDQQQAAVRGEVESQGLVRQLELRLAAGSKRVRADGKTPDSLTSYLSGLSVVLFTPDDLQVPRGSPGPRRRLLDRAVASVWPAYAALARDYTKVLASRNKVLREVPRGVEDLLSVYDQQLAGLGARMVAGRRRFLQGLQQLFAETFDSIDRSGVLGELTYVSTPPVMEAGVKIEDLTRVMADQLQQHQRDDLARKATRLGPHADDLDFLLDGRTTRSFGSQGQVRAVVLALRIAQIKNTYDTLGFYPVLLLDDVSGELDRHRNVYLFDFISKIDCQTFLTTTRADLIHLDKDRVDFQVVNGSIAPA